MEGDRETCAQFGSCHNILEGSYFALTVHQTGKANRLVGWSDPCPAFRVHRPEGAPSHLCWLPDRSVFHWGEEHGPVEWAHSPDRKVVGFGASGGEEHILRIETERLGNLLASSFEFAASAPSRVVQARGIARAASFHF